MEKYELLYILPAKHTEEELAELAKMVNEIVVNQGGKILEEHYMGRRKLAYPIKHVRYGHYYLVIFEAEKEVVAKLNATMRLTTEILRHIVLIRDPFLVGVPELREEETIVRTKEKTERTSRRRSSDGKHAESKSDDSSDDEVDMSEEDDDENEKSDEAVKVEDKSPSKKEEKKVTMEELDKKLDKILTDDIL